MAPTGEQRSLLEGRSLVALCMLAHKHSVDTDGCETKAAVIEAILACLERKSLMALCLLAHEQDVNTDSCETKAAVIEALLGSGKAVGGAPPPAAVRQAAPAWGMDLSPGASPIAEVSQEPANKRSRTTTEASTPAQGPTASPSGEVCSSMANTTPRSSASPHGTGSSLLQTDPPTTTINTAPQTSATSAGASLSGEGSSATTTHRAAGTTVSPPSAGGASPSEGCTPSTHLREMQETSAAPQKPAASLPPEKELSAMTTTATRSSTVPRRADDASLLPREKEHSTRPAAAPKSADAGLLPEKAHSATTTTATRRPSTTPQSVAAISLPPEKERSVMTTTATTPSAVPQGAGASLPLTGPSAIAISTAPRTSATTTHTVPGTAATSPRAAGATRPSEESAAGGKKRSRETTGSPDSIQRAAGSVQPRVRFTVTAAAATATAAAGAHISTAGADPRREDRVTDTTTNNNNNNSNTDVNARTSTSPHEPGAGLPRGKRSAMVGTATVPPRKAVASLVPEEERSTTAIPAAQTAVLASPHGAGANPPPSKRFRETPAPKASSSPHETVASLPSEEEHSSEQSSATTLTASGTTTSLHGAGVSPPEERGPGKRLRETPGGATIPPSHEAGAGVPPEEDERLAILIAATGTSTWTGAGTSEEGAPGKRLRETPRAIIPISPDRQDPVASVPPEEAEAEDEGEYSAMTHPAALRSLAKFVPDTQFLFFATVCKGWRAAWGTRPALTSHVSRDSSLSQLRYSIASGLPRHGVDLCTSFARLGRLDLVRYSRTKGYRYNWNWRTTATLARAGDLKLLKMALRNGCEWNETTTASAARGGHVNLLRWALKHGCPYDATLCAGAARGGHLSILRGARKRSFPWDTRTTMWAAAGGHIRVLKWARKNGCRWKLKKCYRSADRHGHAHVMQWIEKLSRWCASGSSEMLVVGREQKPAAAAAAAVAAAGG